MASPARGTIGLAPGPVADAVTRAREALARSDAAELDAAYRRAAELAATDPAIWAAVAANHVEGLQQLNNAVLALRRCTEYLDGAGGDHLALRLQRAQIRSGIADHAGAAADAVAIRAAQRHPGSLTPEDDARLHRVEGLSAADRGDPGQAMAHLDAAMRLFLQDGHQAGVAVIELDRREIEARQGRQPAVFDVLAGERPQSVAEYRLVAMELRRQSRYEEALHVLWHCAAHEDLDPVLAWHVGHDLIVLLRLLRQNDVAEQLLPSLRRAVETLPDPVPGREAVARLSAAGAPSDRFSPQFDRRLQHTRRLIIAAELEEAELLLEELRSQARTDRDVATWHLAAGELQLAKPKRAGIGPSAQAAVSHLSEAAAGASAAALTEVGVCALRSLGRAHARLDADDDATECWAEAHRLEEGIAARQVTDQARIEMLQAAPDEYDERIRAAAEKLNHRGPEATAAIVVAMEAARGAMILENIVPGGKGLTRDLPRPSDLDGACRWVSDMADRVPAAQVVWIIHSAPDRIHHAVMGPGLLHYQFVPSQKRNLERAIDRLITCWSENDQALEASIASGEFDEFLREIAEQLGIGAVIAGLPQRVRRIAMVAGGELSDIPFAALPVPGATEPLGLRYAFSDLPCLSARLPLHQRSVQLRGERLLLVSPPASALTRAAGRPAHTVLDGEDATTVKLRETLGSRRHRQVRIDCHGQHEHADARRSWLQLVPEGPGGRLWAHDLQRMDLSGCGTLVLGACESGMAQRTGRDERVGFVRAALSAGAAAVIAARWIAADPVAATVLDRFERYVRYLPRDLALQRAQLDVYRREPGTPVTIPALEHPARWACWTLYGDSGWQTAARGVHRSLRRSVDQRSQHG